MRLDLNHLLDEDQLTPSQQREIRKLCDYDIKKSHGNLLRIFFKLKNDPAERSYEIHPANLASIIDAYKQAMFYIIIDSAHLTSKGSWLKEEILALAEVHYMSYKNKAPLKIKSQYLYQLMTQVVALMKKSQNVIDGKS